MFKLLNIRTKEGRLDDPSIRIHRACIPLFEALSDIHRQQIILLLTEHDKQTVNEITKHSHLSRPAISHHLKVLRDAGLVAVNRKGTQHYYSLTIDRALQLLKAFIQAVENCD
jgi:ArsR family transcriptional regulator, arsenate/arsenite/antimonite-responsive transcriptional repressor